MVINTGVGLPDDMWTESPTQLPFGGEATASLIIVAMCLAAGLGLRQSMGESIGGTFQFLLHRPASRGWLIGVKLLVGLGWCLGISALPILLYGWWAATRGPTRVRSSGR